MHYIVREILGFALEQFLTEIYPSVCRCRRDDSAVSGAPKVEERGRLVVGPVVGEPPQLVVLCQVQVDVAQDGVVVNKGVVLSGVGNVGGDLE